MGAWIEILIFCTIHLLVPVAPHVGAWIEILCHYGGQTGKLVAPHVGAWIEICEKPGTREVYESHPTWVRGLK